MRRFGLLVALVLGCEGAGSGGSPTSTRASVVSSAAGSANASATTSPDPAPAAGPLYSAMRYRSIGQRALQPLGHAPTKARIARWAAEHPDATLDDMIRFVLDVTRDSLSFVFERAERAPDRVLEIAQANCVGYAALFAAVFTELARRQGRGASYRAEHRIGKISVAGRSLHGLVASPFFRDHDYNRVVDTKSGSELLVDPSLYEVAGIVYVARDGGTRRSP